MTLNKTTVRVDLFTNLHSYSYCKWYVTLEKNTSLGKKDKKTHPDINCTYWRIIIKIKEDTHITFYIILSTLNKIFFEFSYKNLNYTTSSHALNVLTLGTTCSTQLLPGLFENDSDNVNVDQKVL